MSEYLEMVRFTVKPGAREAFLAGREAAIGALKERFPAMLGAQLAEYEDGSWVDVVRWSNLDDAKAAAEQFPEIEAARDWLNHIDEVGEMAHAAVRHAA